MLKILFFLIICLSMDFYVLSHWKMYGALFLGLFMITFYDSRKLYDPRFLITLVIIGIINDILNSFYLGSSSLVYILLTLNNIYFAGSNLRHNFSWQILTFIIGYIDYTFITLIQCYGVNFLNHVDQFSYCLPSLTFGCVILIWTKYYHPNILEFEDSN